MKKGERGERAGIEEQVDAETPIPSHSIIKDHCGITQARARVKLNRSLVARMRLSGKGRARLAGLAPACHSQTLATGGTRPGGRRPAAPLCAAGPRP